MKPLRLTSVVLFPATLTGLGIVLWKSKRRAASPLIPHKPEMSLCFTAAWEARCSNKITEGEYYSHMLAHFRGIRHPDDSQENYHHQSRDTVLDSIRRIALKNNYPVIEDIIPLEEIFASCRAGNVDDVKSGLAKMKGQVLQVALQPLATLATVKADAQMLKLCLEQGAVFDEDVDNAVAEHGKKTDFLELLYAKNWHDMQNSQDTLNELLQTYMDAEEADKLLSWLIDHGARTNAETGYLAGLGPTLLPTLKLLAKNGGLEHIRYPGALQLAAQRGDIEVVKYFLDVGVDIDELPPPIDEREPGPETALYEAVQNRHIDVIRLLLQRGADPNAPCDSPLLAARRIGEPEILDLLEKDSQQRKMGSKPGNS